MIRSHFGLEANPFDLRHSSLLPHQQQIFDTIKIHARQGGLCVLMGEPGTGKSVIKQALIDHDPKKLITPTVARTLHTYPGILQILCEGFGLDLKARVSGREKALIEAAWKINSSGKMLVPIIDDAHLVEVDILRRIRLLLEDFPKNHNLLLIAQPGLVDQLRLRSNEDLRSRITYSVQLPRLNPDDIRAFIHGQFDRVRLAHNTLTDEALELIIRSCDGVLRRVRNLCLSALLEAVRDRKREVGLDQVNRVLMQPHWRQENDILDKTEASSAEEQLAKG